MMRRFRYPALVFVLATGIGAGCGTTELSRAYKPDLPDITPPHPDSVSRQERSAADSIVLPETPAAVGGKPYPINLPTAMKLGNIRGLDISFATQRLQTADAMLQGARVLWLPSILSGGDYNRHDGQIQAIDGTILGTSRSSMMFGWAPNLVVGVADAMFSPLATRQLVRARRAEVQAATNDTLMSVTQAYFNVQQARGELAGLTDALKRAEDLLNRLDKLAPAIVPELEVHRARSDVARLRQSRLQSENNWRAASAELLRVLFLDPTVVVEPLEPPHLQVELFPLDKTLNDLVAIALTNRPELAAQQALVQQSLRLLQAEKARPFIPQVLLRGWSTPVTGTLGAGYFGGGLNSYLGSFSWRQDYDIQLIWAVQNFGLGTLATIRRRAAENRTAVVDQLRVQTRVAAEVVQANALAQTAAGRVKHAESELREAQKTVEQSLIGVSQPRRLGNLLQLIVRPQEVVAAVNALSRAYSDYYGAIGDYNRAQFQLYRALGYPAQALLNDPRFCATASAGKTADEPPEPNFGSLHVPRKVVPSNPATERE